jgi:peptidoglycan DL-endopeptidase CwlO
MATAGHPARLLPRAVLSTLVSALLVVTITAPGQAQPGTGTVPDPGARPEATGQLPLPGMPGNLPAAPSIPPLGPLAAEIAQKEIELQGAIQQLATIEPQVAPAGTAADVAEQELLLKTAALEEAEQALDELVGVSYRGAAALPPDLFIPELPGLQAHAPAVPVDAPIGAEAAARDYIRARDEAQAAATNLELTQNTEQTLEEQAAQLEDTIERLTAELEDLRDRNAEQLVEQEREREAAAQDDASVSNAPVNGFRPHAKALEAVEFALGELGKPYVWGAEGPNAYDCSGLVLASYLSVGRTLPRVANDQYWGTRDKLVTRSPQQAQQGLLPGDLVFFASGFSWQSIHHVGIYVGNGLMVHAPNSREVVKVSPVWWGRFFAATRVFDATPVPDNNPNPQPGTPPSPPGSGRPTTPPPTTTPPTTTPPTTNPPTTEPPPPTTTVPNLAGLTAEAAQTALTEAGLVAAPPGEPFISTSCDPGEVAEQAPPAGNVVVEGTTVTFRICQAPSPSPDPDPDPQEPTEEPATEEPNSSPTPT